MIKTANLAASVSRNAGGLFESVRRLVQSLADTGMDVRVFGTEDEHTAADIGLWSPVSVKVFRPIGPRQFGYSPYFREALEEFGPDLVHTHGLWLYPSIASSQYRRGRDTPYVISAHGMLDPWAVRNSRWKKVIAHFFYEGSHLRHASCLRALCESEARAMRRLGLNNPIAIISNGIDLPVFQNAESGGQGAEAGGPSSVAILPSLSPWAGVVEPGRKVLLFLSRIHPKKGLVNLLKAWAAVRTTDDGRRKAEGWVLAIAGWDEGGHERELKRLATELGIPWADCRERRAESREQKTAVSGQRSEVSSPSSVVRSPLSALPSPPSVVFLGPQFNQAKQACYVHCDGFILPSFSEGVPMVVLEAWAHGKPVLMTPECNLPIGFARQAAIRIETTPESIAQGLRELFRAQSSNLCSLGSNGLCVVREQFVWPVLGGEMARLYEWLLGGGSPPACIAGF